jgi:hypothetical protein
MVCRIKPCEMALNKRRNPVHPCAMGSKYGLNRIVIEEEVPF